MVLCENVVCGTRANFNTPGESKARFCSTHKLKGMQNVRVKLCEHPNCITMANFNFLGEKKSRFCKRHAISGMVNVRSDM